MKRGPNTLHTPIPSTYPQEANAPISSLSEMNADIMSHIMQYIPYRLLGRNSLSTVCKEWMGMIETIKKQYRWDPNNFKQLINVCLNSPEAVLYVLKDEIFSASLDIEKKLLICGCHPELAIFFIE